MKHFYKFWGLNKIFESFKFIQSTSKFGQKNETYHKL